jgi:glycosyltransferase involved in cell wall biosynthesis
MKFAMFTPGLQASAIGRVACMVTQALLAQGHSVVVVRAEQTELLDRPTHDFGAPVVAWNAYAQIDQLLREVDMAIYHVGDNYAYHFGCTEWLPRCPGVVCLHDFFVGHLFWAWAQGRRPQATGLLEALYGSDTAERYFAHDAANFIAGTRDTAPLSEWISAQACGVVTHSSWGLQRVLGACPGPVRVVPLPYEPPPAAHVPAGTQAGEFKVLTVGNVNPNKRTESVIRAIGDSKVLRDTTTYRLVGAIAPEMRERLAAIARSAGVRLVISGESPVAELSAALADADVVCCMRWPTLEAASASTIEAMLCAKAVIVEDAGFYAELPDDCVAKVRPEQEVLDVRLALERLAADAQARRQMGERAARWAAATFTASNYAQQLVEITVDCWRAKPALQVIDAAAEQLRLWGDVPHLLASEAMLGPLALFDAAPVNVASAG